MNTEAKPPASVKGEGPFAGYDLDSRFYDEMFDSGVLRASRVDG